MKFMKLVIALAGAVMLPAIGTAEKLTLSEETKACMECHSGTTEIGQKILSAKAGWNASVHANGQRVEIIADHDVIGYYWGGSAAFMGNGSSCQVCHTNEGFLNSIAGKYETPAAAAAEVILHPSPPGCFTCHTPHEDNDFEKLTVPNNTIVMNGTEGVYDKPKGAICASCHHARLMNGRVATFDTVGERILDSLKEPAPLSGHFGAHYGGEADILVGANGAEYEGREYPADSAHSADKNSNCVSCHMPMRTDMMSHLSANLTGHSFEITGPQGDGLRANLGGCESCHNIVKGVVSATRPLTESAGYLVKGRFYFQDFQDYANSTAEVIARLEAPKQPSTMVNDILVKLADPDNGCTGLLSDAFDKVTGATNGISWSNTEHERCHVAGYARVNLPSASSETDPSARLLKAIWNFDLITVGDGSMGMHNLNYTLRLLYDSCSDLHDLVGGDADLATACNDPVNNRP